MVRSLISKGKSISTVEGVLKGSRKDIYYRKLLCASVNPNIKFLSFEDTIAGKINPGGELLLSSFLNVFWKNEVFYRRRLHEITINQDWICCDHMFKSAMNIGMYQQKTGSQTKWVKQFKALFLVLNDVGQTLTWRLVQDTSYDSLGELLLEIKERLIKQGKELREVYVDDCCKSRKKIQNIFGDDILVKLDIFHAVQRITKKVSKRHAFFHDFISSLKLVFRSSSDLGINRGQSTPDPKILEKNINMFVQRWTGVKSDNGNTILTTAIIQEVNKLKAHIRNGCLSDIKPGRGTNRDESFHRSLNSFMKYSKIGTELAYALLTTTIDDHNERREANDRKSFLEYMTMQQMTHQGNLQQIYVDTPKFGLTNTKSNQDMNINDYTLEENTEDTEDIFTHDQLIEVLNKAKELYDAVVTINSKGMTTSVFNARYFPFMNSATSLFFHGNFNQNRDGFDAHNARLHAVVQSWGFQMDIVEGDGNCFFYSASVSLHQLFENNEADCTHLYNMGITTDMSIVDTAQRLRELVVNKWITNQERYQPFVGGNMEEQANLFLRPGHFMGELGNLMPLAMANLIGSALIIFTSLETMPVLLITPSSTSGLPPIYLAFNQFGAGHYDAIKFEQKEETSSTVMTSGPVQPVEATTQRCSCGKNSKRTSNKSIKQSCVNSQGYASRCPCLKAKNGCHSDCSCKECSNPYGKNDKLISDSTHFLSSPRPRKRAKHSLSGTRTNAEEFMEKMNTKTQHLEWNMIEIIIFECLIELFRNLKIVIDSDNLQRCFNKLVEKTAEINFKFEMDVLKKTINEIKKRMESHDKALKAWLNAYYRKQIEENLQ